MNNNNQGPRPSFPGGVIPPTQNRPQDPQNSMTSSSPFANPPPSNSSSNTPMMVRPGPAPSPMGRPAPFQVNGNPGAPMNSARPPMPVPRPSLGTPGTSAPMSPQIANRPPMPQTGNRPPMPQISQLAPGQSPSMPSNRPPMPQNAFQSSANRPPINQINIAPSGQSIPSPNLTRPPMPMRPPPLPQTQTPQAAITQPMPPMTPQASVPSRPLMPQVSQASNSPFARPPTTGPQKTQMNGLSVPSHQTPSTPNMRPPIPMGASPMRPPLPGVQASSAPQRPPLPGAQTPSMPLRPPVSSPQQINQHPMRPPMSPMVSRPPVPTMPQIQQPAVPPMPSGPAMNSAPSRYPPTPGYAQPGFQGQQPGGYSQTTSMPPTQQAYPSYPQTQHPQGYAGGNMVTPQQHPPAPKVNPAAIPSVVSVLEADETRFKETGQPFYTFSSVIDHPPPLPTTRSVSIIDDGNSSPQFIRSTLNHIPISEEICDNTKIPLSLLIQPFASGPQTDVPLVDFGAMGPLRCNRCRAYINAHVQFIKGGRYFVCNLCDMSNEVPEEYYANLDMSGKRIDLDLRPELKFGTVDFVASKEYLNRPAGKPHLLFVLDASRAAIGSGAFHAALESIKAFAKCEQALKFYGGMAILVQDRTLTFYTLREGRNEPQVLVVGDVFDPFVPLHANDLYFDPIKCASGLSVLFNHLSSTMTLESRPVDSCFGAAVSAALDSLKVRGGRAVFFQTTLPSYGPGALKNREATAAPAPADKANPLLFPQGDYYTKLANQAAEQGVSISLVSTPSAHIDLATIGILPNVTSGTLLHYSRFTAQQHMGRLIGDVIGLLSSSFVFDCLARIRCNSGLQVKKHYGHFYAASNGHDLSFGTLSTDQAFAALLEYDGKLSEKERASFQIAFLHTDAFSGQRRIRVLNLALPCSSSIQTIFRMAELDSILSFYLKKNVSQILEAPSPAFPASFTSKCANILAAYRRYCAANMSSGQLILPDSLKLFPIMTLAIHKDPAFNDSPKSADTRWYSIHRLSDMSLLLTITHFYPQLFPLTNILEHEEVLPACIRLSREHLSREGIYLMNNGNTLTLYIGDSVDSNVLKEIFGVPQLNAVNLVGSNLPVLQNARSAKLRQIITVLKSQNYPRHLNLRLIRQSVDIAEDAEFASLLVEDASSLSPSYVDFLCRVHSTIQHNISQGASLSLAERTSILSFLQ